MLFALNTEGNLLQVDASSQISRKNSVENARCRISRLLRFSFMGRQGTNEPDINEEVENEHISHTTKTPRKELREARFSLHSTFSCRQYTSYVTFSHAVNTHSLLHITLHGSRMCWCASSHPHSRPCHAPECCLFSPYSSPCSFRCVSPVSSSSSV